MSELFPCGHTRCGDSLRQCGCSVCCCGDTEPPTNYGEQIANLTMENDRLKALLSLSRAAAFADAAAECERQAERFDKTCKGAMTHCATYIRVAFKESGCYSVLDELKKRDKQIAAAHDEAVELRALVKDLAEEVDCVSGRFGFEGDTELMERVRMLTTESKP